MPMVVGILKVDLYVSQSGSLKEKRRVVQSVKRKIQNQFNVAIAEVGEHGDLWQRATLGIAAIANDVRFVNAVLDKVENTIAASPEIQIIHREMRFV